MNRHWIARAEQLLELLKNVQHTNLEWHEKYKTNKVDIEYKKERIYSFNVNKIIFKLNVPVWFCCDWLKT